jgi:alkylation response protein AidB-like acyl-CoA dehydrogenase
MDFRDSPEEAAFRAELRAWIGQQQPFAAVPHDDDVRVAFLSDWQGRLFDAGWAAVSFPAEFGGRGLPAAFEAIVLDELAAAGAPPVWHYGYVARIVLDHGTPEQRERFIRPALRGDQRWCQGFSEPDAGSDLAALTTRAVRDGDDYIVTGQKVWTSEAHWADWCLLLARSEEEGERQHQRPRSQSMSCFLVPLPSPGLTVRPFRQITGSLEFAELFFDGVRVPASFRLGDAGGGWSIAMSTVALERGPADVGFIADFQRTVGALADAARSGVLPPGRDALRRVARAYVDVEVLRLHVLRSLSRRAQGEPSETQASIDKLLMTRTEQELARTRLDLAGADALLGGAPAPLHDYLWSRAASVYGGSSQIQRNIVATRILGLPRS